MSVIAKILIVLNLLLAVVFLGAAATFLGQQEAWKIKYEKMQKEKETEISELNTKLKNAQQSQREQAGIAQTAQKERDDIKSRFETSQGDYATMEKHYNTLLGQYERLSQTYKDAIAQITSLTKEKDDLVTAKDQALGEKRQAIEGMNNAVAEQKRLQSKIDDLNGELAETNKRLNATGEELASTKLVVDAYTHQFGQLSDVTVMPKIAAKVTAVDNDLNIVMFSVGRDDGVKAGYTFTVYRGGKYVGKVTIDRVDKDFCSGESKKPLEAAPIQVGDDATTVF
jgi:chromosome segregation ATPase